MKRILTYDFKDQRGNYRGLVIYWINHLKMNTYDCIDNDMTIYPCVIGRRIYGRMGSLPISHKHTPYQIATFLGSTLHWIPIPSTPVS